MAFSTLRVELREPEPEPESPPTGERTPFHEQSPVAVFLSSVAGLVRFARTAFIAGVAALPWAVGLGVPAVLAVRAGRRFGAPSRLPVGDRRDSVRFPARDDVTGDGRSASEADSGTGESTADADESEESSDGSEVAGDSDPDSEPDDSEPDGSESDGSESVDPESDDA